MTLPICKQVVGEEKEGGEERKGTRVEAGAKGEADVKSLSVKALNF